MASTPSSSALSAVLRCRGNIWARNPPSRRPAASVYSLGLAGWGERDAQPERNRSHQASAWEAFLQEKRVSVGRKLTVKSTRTGGKALRKKDSGQIKKSCHLKLSQISCDAPGVQNAWMRQPARSLATHLLGIEAVSRINRITKDKTRVCKIVFVKGVRELSTGVLKVSKTSTRLMGNRGQVSSAVLAGCSAVKHTCLALTALVSDFMFVKLEVLRQDGRPDSTQHLPNQRAEETTDSTQENGLIYNPTDLISCKDSSSFPERTTEERPV